MFEIGLVIGWFFGIFVYWISAYFICKKLSLTDDP